VTKSRAGSPANTLDEGLFGCWQKPIAGMDDGECQPETDPHWALDVTKFAVGRHTKKHRSNASLQSNGIVAGCCRRER